MNLGVIVRADARGLGHQSRAVYEHMNPERTLLVDPGELARGWVQNYDWYPDATTVLWDGHRFIGDDTERAREWLRGLDVVWTAETAYDHRFPQWCAELGVGLVVMMNAEFDRWSSDATYPRPTAFWTATPWRLDRLPDGVRVVPMPAPDMSGRVRDGAGGFLHIAGHRTVGDRNGTTIVARSWPLSRQEQRWTLTAQDSTPIVRPPRRIAVTQPPAPDDHRDLYEMGDVLMLPRRYGGLCLPALEAFAAGLVVAMPRCVPNTIWPILPLPCRGGKLIRTAAGLIETFDVHPRLLAAEADRLVGDPERIVALSEAGLTWARDNSWAALTPLWLEELERVAEMAVV